MSKKWIIVSAVIVIIIIAIIIISKKKTATQTVVNSSGETVPKPTLDSLGNDTTNKTTGGKLLSNAGDFATSILGVTRQKLEASNIELAGDQLAYNRQLLELEKQKQEDRKKITTIVIAIIVILVVGLSYILFIRPKTKVI